MMTRCHTLVLLLIAALLCDASAVKSLRGDDATWERIQRLTKANGGKAQRTTRDIQVEIERAPKEVARLLPKLKGVSSLALKRVQWPADEYANIGRVGDLRCLLIEDCQLTAASMAKIAQPLKLQILWVDRGTMSHDALHEISKYKGLRDLRLGDVKNLKIGDFDALEDLPKLDFLDLSGCDVGDIDVIAINKLTSLKSLSLERTRITNTAVPHIMDLPNLEDFWGRGTRISKRNLERIDEVTARQSRLRVREKKEQRSGLRYDRERSR